MRTTGGLFGVWMPCNPQDLGCLCSTCPLSGSVPVTPLNIRKPSKRSLAIVLDSPSKDDLKDGRFGRGYTGHILRDRVLKHVGVKGSSTHLTSAVLCRPTRFLSPPDWKNAVAACRPRLDRELKATGVKVALAMGSRALQALTGKVQHTKFLGAVMPGEDFFIGGRIRGTRVADFTHLEVSATEPVDRLFKDNWNLLPVIRSHVEKAYRRAIGELPDWEWGPMYLDPDDAMLDALYRLAEDPDPMAVDIETTGIDPWSIDITRIGFANSKLAISVPWCDWQGVNGVRPERTEMDRLIVEATKKVLVGPQVKIFQNGIFDKTTFRAHGIECRGPYFDTLYAHNLYSPGTKHDLGFQAGQEFWANAWKQDFKGFKKENEK